MTGVTDFWQVLKSHVIFRNKWFTVRRDECLLPHGTIIDDYYVIELPPGAVIVAVTKDREMVLVKQYKHGAGREVLELPAGNVEPDEEPVDSARRELLEETGYRSNDLIHVGTLECKPARMSAKTYVYLANGVTKERTQVCLDQEAITVETVPLDDVPALVANGSIVTEASLAALALCLPQLL